MKLFKKAGNNNKKRLSPQEKDRVSFERFAKMQFLRLKKQGLSISVMTL
jgi:hypothetical protein